MELESFASLTWPIQLHAASTRGECRLHRSDFENVEIPWAAPLRRRFTLCSREIGHKNGLS